MKKGRIYPCSYHTTQAFELTLRKTHLPQLMYCFTPIRQVEVAAITCLLGHVSVADERHLCLEGVEEWLTKRPTKAKRWRDLFITLLETALRKGCRSMCLRDTDYLRILPADYIVLLHPPRRQPFGRKLARWFGRCLQFDILSIINSRRWTPSFITSSLTFLNLRSSMMLQPLFLPHTLSLIHSQSSVLRKLKLVAEFTWKLFLKCLSLPVFNEFVYRQDEHFVDPVVTAELVLGFLIRHQTICKVKLYDVGMEELPDFEPAVLLPNLVALDAHPRLISWFLQYPNGFPELVYVSLAVLQIAFFFLALIPHHQRKAKPPSVQVQCRSWPILLVQAHTTDSSQSPLRGLKGIRCITISTLYYLRLDLDVLPTWLGLCPSLRWLRIRKLERRGWIAKTLLRC